MVWKPSAALGRTPASARRNAAKAAPIRTRQRRGGYNFVHPPRGRGFAAPACSCTATATNQRLGEGSVKGGPGAELVRPTEAASGFAKGTRARIFRFREFSRLCRQENFSSPRRIASSRGNPDRVVQARSAC